MQNPKTVHTNLDGINFMKEMNNMLMVADIPNLARATNIGVSLASSFLMKSMMDPRKHRKYIDENPFLAPIFLYKKLPLKFAKNSATCDDIVRVTK